MQGGIIDKDMPIDAVNVMLVHKGKPTRVGYQIDDDGNEGPRRQAHRGGDRMSEHATARPRRRRA